MRELMTCLDSNLKLHATPTWRFIPTGLKLHATPTWRFRAAGAVICPHSVATADVESVTAGMMTPDPARNVLPTVLATLWELQAPEVPEPEKDVTHPPLT